MKRKNVLIGILIMTVWLLSVSFAQAKTYSKTYSKKVRGTTDIVASANFKSNFYIYSSKNKYKKHKPDQVLKNKKSISWRLKKTGPNKYYVKVKSTRKSVRTKCTITQHVDKKKTSKSINWITKPDSGVYNPQIIYHKSLFFSKNDVAKALLKISEDKALKRQTRIAALTWFMSTNYIGAYSSSKFVNGLIAATDFASIFKGTDFNQVTYKEAKKITGYSKGKAKRGLRIDYYFHDGIEFLELKPWNGKLATGPKGYVGNWSY